MVLALDHSDEDYAEVYADRIIDLNFVIARLRITDCWEFASSMKSRENRTHALMGCLLKGIALRWDVREVLSMERVVRGRPRIPLLAVPTFLLVCVGWVLYFAPIP